MIRAVCFDLFNTLARYEPPREVVHANACCTIGVEVSPEAVAKALPLADKFWRDENARSPINKRSQKEVADVYADYEVRLLQEIGREISHETALQIMAKLWDIGLKFDVYDDSLSVLKLLKDRRLITGLISNVGQDVDETCQKLGMQPYLDFRVTSFEVGYDKPRPEIFWAALEKAQTEPEETIYVGDQYDLDIVGARNVGITPVLIDRNNEFTHITDCPRIQSLTEIVEYI